MMVMMIRRFSLLLLLLLPALALEGQKSDFGIWYDVKADHELIKNLRIDAEACVRTENNASDIESWYLEPGIRYKFNKYFSGGVYYRFIEQMEKDNRLHPRHRWFIQIKGDLPVYRFTLSARYRIQEQFKTYIDKPEDEIPSWYNRLRLEIDYDVPSIPLRPYINTELHSQLFASNDIMIEKMRYIGGIEYTLNKRHTFGLEYVYNTSKVSKPAYMNVISLTYSIKI